MNAGRQIIDLKDHPSNNCITGKLVWEDRVARHHVYSVRGGYVACPEFGSSFEGLFDTEKDAREYLQMHRPA